MLHPQAAQLLKVMEQSGTAPVHRLTPVEARQVYRDRRLFTQPSPPDVGSIRDLQAEGPGGLIALRMYHSLSHASNEPLPVPVYYHGGGFVIGELDTHDVLCRELANASGCAVVAVDYRLAPEILFPPPSSIVWRRPSGYIVRRLHLVSTRAEWRSGGDSGGGNSRPLSASWRATKVARRSAFSC